MSDETDMCELWACSFNAMQHMLNWLDAHPNATEEEKQAEIYRYNDKVFDHDCAEPKS